MNIAIIGAGASGLVTAISAMQNAAEKNTDCHVTLFEAKDRVGKKILVTGNGRCNMLNKDKTPFYFSVNSFHSYAIDKYNAQSNLDFFNRLGLYTRTDEEGRVYPLSNQASTVLDVLRLECENLKIRTVTDCEITSLKKEKSGFLVNNEMRFDKVVLACGGKAGVKSFNGYDLLRQLNHKVTKVTPSLSKLNVSDTGLVKQLQGIRHKVKLTLNAGGRYVTEEKGELLFAKYGLSGIAAMQLSAYITRLSEKDGKVIVYADFVPDYDYSFIANAMESLICRNREIRTENLLSGFMPKKLGEAVMKEMGYDVSGEAVRLKKTDIINIAKRVKKYPFVIHSVRPFEDAQVTAGGADTSLFNPKTMESRLHKGFYAVGEVLDVDGLCGGYNLMWAWSSARLCGESIVR